VIAWRFVSQARGTSFLFDDVLTLEGWSEDDIAELLRERTRAAGIEVSFERLVADLTPDLDDPDRAAALDHAARNYFRLIWDYSDGNPGVALQTWSTSLGVAADERIYATPFRVPDARCFDRLPDSAVFVLRAALQLERAQPEVVAKATMATVQEVETALRFGEQQGYVERVGDRYAITWTWYRPLTRFLQRRHLLATQ
jgi:hypothetical protein